MTYFLADGGAIYLVEGDTATADRTRTVYTSPDNRLVQTGKFRIQPRLGWGARAVLHLDTGEGMSVIPGVVR